MVSAFNVRNTVFSTSCIRVFSRHVRIRAVELGLGVQVCLMSFIFHDPNGTKVTCNLAHNAPRTKNAKNGTLFNYYL